MGTSTPPPRGRGGEVDARRVVESGSTAEGPRHVTVECPRHKTLRRLGHAPFVRHSRSLHAAAAHACRHAMQTCCKNPRIQPAFDESGRPRMFGR